MNPQRQLAIIMKYLRDHHYIESLLQLQRQSKFCSRNYSKEISFLRDLIMHGDFNGAAKLLKPLQMKLTAKDYNDVLFRLYQQRLLELIEEPDEAELRDLLEKTIVKYCSAEQYQGLFQLLVLQKIADHQDFKRWTKIGGRLACFEYILPFVQIIQSNVNVQEENEVGLRELIEFYDSKKTEDQYGLRSKLNLKGIQFKKQEGKVSDRTEEANLSGVIASRISKTQKSQKLQRSEREAWQTDRLEESRKLQQPEPFRKSQVSYKPEASLRHSRQEPISMTLTPSVAIDSTKIAKMLTSKSIQPIKQADPLAELHLSKSIKINEEQQQQPSEQNQDLSQSRQQQQSKEPSSYNKSDVYKSKSAVLHYNIMASSVKQLEPVDHFEYRSNAFSHMMKSTKQTSIRLVGSTSDEKAMRVCQFSDNGKHLAVGTNSSKLKIFNVESLFQKKVSTVQLQPVYEIANLHQKSVFSIDWSANQKFLASCSNDATVKLTKLSAQLDEHEINIIGRHDASIRMVRFDGLLTKIVSCAEDHLIKIWDIQKPKAFQVLKGHYSSVNAIHLKQNESGKLIYSVSKDCSVRMWDMRTGQPQAISKPHESQMTYIARNTQNLMVSHKDGSISFYTPSLQLIESIQVHKEEVRSVQSSQDETYYISASFDGQICLMQLGDNNKLVKSYHRHNLVKDDDKVVYAAFNQNVGFASCSTFGVCNIFSIN